MRSLCILLFLFTSTFGYSVSLPTPNLSFPSNNSNHLSPLLGLGCSSVTAATSYEFRYANNVNFIGATSVISVTNQTWIFDLFFATQYFWQARACNSSDTSNWSAVFNFRTINDVNLVSPLNGSANENVDVQLVWDQIDGIIGYEIELDTVETFNSPSLISIFEGGNTSTNTIDLLFGTIYYWRVRAISNVDTTNWSPDFVFLTVGQPSLLFPLNTSLLIAPNPSLSWFGLSGINGYELQIDTTFDYSSAGMQSIILGLNPFYQLNDLYFGKFYNWRVRAFHSADTSDWSGSYNFSVYDKPTSILPNSNDTVFNTELNFSWIGSAGVNGYELQVDTITDFSSPLLVKKFESNTNATVQDLNFGLTYYWRVRAYHNADSSAWSFIRSFTVVEKPNLISPVDSFLNAETAPKFEWNNIQNIDYFEFNLDTAESFNSGALLTSQLNDSSTSIQNLYYNQLYYWKVRAVNDVDTSLFSNTRIFTTYKNPTLINPINLATTISINPTVIWSNYAGNTYDEIQLSTDSDFTSPIFAQVTGGTISFSSLIYNTDYWWRVRSINSVDTSEWSTVFKFTTEPELNVAPNLVSPSNSSINILCPDTNLVWNGITGLNITGYEVEIDSSIDFSNATVYSTVDTTIQLNNLIPYTNYYWRVRGVNISGPGIWSVVWTFKTSGTTGLYSPIENNNLLICNNPFKTELLISSISTSELMLAIYNELGKLLLKRNFSNQITINSSEFIPGVYIITLTDLNTRKVVAKKVIKN